MLSLHLSKFACSRKLSDSARCFLAIQSLCSNRHSLSAIQNDQRSCTKRFQHQESPQNLNSEKASPNTYSPLKSIKQKLKPVYFDEQENIWTIPNILCCTRIAFSPYLGILICDGRFKLAFYVMVLVGLTDLLDGAIARNFSSQASKFGTFLDPLADKIFIATTCISLTCVNLIPVPLTILILSRDVLLAASGFYIRYKTLPPPKTLSRYFDATHATAKLEPTGISKFNTIVQLAAIGTGLISPVVGFADHPYLLYLWCFTATTTVASAISYVYQRDKYMYSK